MSNWWHELFLSDHTDCSFSWEEANHSKVCKDRESQSAIDLCQHWHLCCLDRHASLSEDAVLAKGLWWHRFSLSPVSRPSKVWSLWPPAVLVAMPGSHLILLLLAHLVHGDPALEIVEVLPSTSNTESPLSNRLVKFARTLFPTNLLQAKHKQNHPTEIGPALHPWLPCGWPCRDWKLLLAVWFRPQDFCSQELNRRAATQGGNNLPNVKVLQPHPPFPWPWAHGHLEL